MSFFMHSAQVFMILLNKKSRRAASAPMHAFFESKKMENGGDLRTAMMKGPLTSTVYTHPLGPNGGGTASYFVSLEGVKLIMDELPNQDENARTMYRNLFEEFLGDQSKAAASIQLATPEQCAGQLDDDDMMNESKEVDIIPRVLDREWCYRFALQSEREKSELKLQVKDAELEIVKTKYDANKKVSTAELKAKDAEMEKERAKHEADRMRWEMEKLQSKMSRVRENRRPESAKNDTESDEERVPVARKSDKPRKLKVKLSHFAQICVFEWDNDHPGVNFFADLPDDAPGVFAEPPTFSVNELIARMVNGPSNESPDNKQFVMALHYKGRRASKQALLDSCTVKEAYGVEADGVQYLCLVLYKNNGRRMATVANAFYESGIVPRNVVPERIVDPRTGGFHHISVFKVAGMTDDPVMTMLKKPNYTKWRWFNTKWGK